MAGIANKLKHALRLDSNAGRSPADETGAAPSATANPVGPGTEQTSTGAGVTHTSDGSGLQSGSTGATTGRTGELHNTSGTGAPTGQTAELRSSGVTGGTTGGVTSSSSSSTRETTHGTIGSTGIPAGSDMPLPDRSTLTSSEDHWQKAQEATEEARRQAKLVEAGAKSHAEATEEFYHAERDHTKAQHTVEEIETKIRNLGLEDKQRRLKETRAAYESEKQRLSSLYGPAEKLRSEADAAQDVVNTKGHELEAQVQESKLYSDRLAALEAELGEARLAAQEARDRHAKHLAELEPLANKHRHHKSERERLAAKLASLRGALDAMRKREGEAQRALEVQRAEHESVGAELAELEDAARRKEQEAAAHLAELERLQGQREHLAGLLGQHRETVSSMTKDTQDTMARAQAQSDTADAHAAELQRTKEQFAASERDLGKNREALSAAVAESRSLEGNARSAADDVETYAQQASALEAELRAAKERVDLAQARKEELWEVAKAEGAAGDKQSDTHYIKNVAEPAETDPAPMVHKSDHTAGLAGKIQYGVESLQHGQEGTTQNQPQV